MAFATTVDASVADSVGSTFSGTVEVEPVPKIRTSHPTMPASPRAPGLFNAGLAPQPESGMPHSSDNAMSGMTRRVPESADL